MLESISPYALLKMSKPKTADLQPEAYDLYSQYAQFPSEQSLGHTPDLVSAQEPGSAVNQPRLPDSGGRTHYISDIHARHSKAFMRTTQSVRSLS